MTVTVVLDTSALLAYTNGSIAVGELLSIITDDEDTALVPAACLAQAYRLAETGQDALLGVLTTVPCVTLAPLDPDDAGAVGAAARPASGVDAGHAVIEAVRHEAQVATREANAVGRLLPPDWPIIEV